MASIMFKDEDELLEGKEDVNKAYVEEILPQKMKWNLSEIRKYGFWRDIKLCFMTVFGMFCKKHNGERYEF